MVAARTLAYAWRLVHGQDAKCVLVGQVLVGERMAEDDQVSEKIDGVLTEVVRC